MLPAITQWDFFVDMPVRLNSMDETSSRTTALGRKGRERVAAAAARYCKLMSGNSLAGVHPSFVRRRAPQKSPGRRQAQDVGVKDETMTAIRAHVHASGI